ncbi:MAG: tetratricopeptide repeat protein [Deferribacterales bacterium]|jgi:tetratricopeptide (TPR) repeat protein
MIRKLIIVTLILCSVSAYAEVKLSPILATALHKAQEKIKNKDFKGAVDTLTEFRKKHTDDAGLYYLLLGNALYSMGDADAAFKTFTSGHAKYQDDKDLCRNAAVTAYELGKFSDAGELFYTLYRLTNTPEELYRSAASWYMKGSMDVSEKRMDELFSREKKRKPEWLKLAVAVKIENGKPRPALALTVSYLRENPYDGDMWELRSQLHLSLEQYTMAASALETAHIIKAPDEKDLKNLADLYGYIGASVRAAKTLAKVSSTDEELLKLSEYYIYAGEYKKGVETMDMLINKSPDRALHTLKGKYLYMAGEYEQALTALEKADENDGEAQMLRAVCGWQMNDLETVKDAYQKASKIRTYSKTANSGLLIVEEIIKNR